jgi:hypothetical protein
VTVDERQRLNIRTIRVSLASALRHLPPDKAVLCIGRARQLTEHARRQATAASVLADIEALETELERAGGAAHQRQG